MKGVVSLNDGSFLTVFSDDDIEEAIREKFSGDIAQRYAEVVAQKDAAENALQEAREENEVEIEHYQLELVDVTAVLESLIYRLKTTSRINKRRLLHDLDVLKEEIKSYT